MSAVERDLRQKYRDDYRVVAAQSGGQALEAARELKRRGTPIALFVVDQRMPDMTGTEFLKEARTLHPDAKRTLLTAYADSEAAIAAINAVGLDYYLMKPWDPPDRCLYPVLDELLADWAARAKTSFEGVRVIGSRWSPQSYETRDFLSRNQIPFQWIDVELDAAMREIAVTANGGSLARLPVVLLADGTTLIAPAHAELAEKIGLQTVPTRPFYDLAIVGAGPAGLACAVYGASEGLKVVLIEQNAPGGQAGTSSMIENYLGFPSGVTGADLARRAATQAQRFGTEILVGHSVTGLRRVDPVQGRAAVQRPGNRVHGAHALHRDGRPRARGAGRVAVPRRRHLLRRGALGSRDVSRAAGAGARRRELGGAGRALLRALRRARHDHRPKAEAVAGDVARIWWTGSTPLATSP